MAKRKLELIEATHDLEEAKNQERSAHVIYQEKIDKLLARFNMLTEKTKALENSSLASTLSNLKGGDPRFILRFHENQGKLKVMLAKLRRDILTVYVDYLTASDNIQLQPLINFFSPRLEVIKMP